jgi:hypothetical protein
MPGVILPSSACRRVRRWSRLRSGSPPCGGVGRSSCSGGPGHLRASRRPAWWPFSTSPRRAPRGCPPRECAQACSKPHRHILKDGTPAGRPIRSPFRACGSRAPLRENRPALARRATGGCPAPVPCVPDVRRRRCVRRCATPRGSVAVSGDRGRGGPPALSVGADAVPAAAAASDAVAVPKHIGLGLGLGLGRTHLASGAAPDADAVPKESGRGAAAISITKDAI